MSGFLLPFDCIASFLEESPAVTLTHVDVRCVYDALIEILTKVQEQKVDEQKRNALRKRKETQVPRCEHCKTGYLQIDTTEAQTVCSDCGVVSVCNMVLERNCQTYDERHDDMIRHERSVPNDVPKWLQKSLDYDNEERHRIEVERELEQLNDNPYIRSQRLSTDDLERAKHHALLPKRANSSVRAVAAILAPTVQKFLDEHDFKEKIKACAALPVLRYTPPIPNYHCLRCGASVDAPYLQRRHPCKWGQVKRKRSFP